MKKLKITFIFIAILLFASCSYSEGSSTPGPVDFKIGQKGFKSKIAEKFSFEQLSFGTYVTKNMATQEKGVNLTFSMKNLNEMDNKTFNLYADAIQKEVKANLLHLSDYDLINIIFEETIEEEKVKKVYSYKTRRLLN